MVNISDYIAAVAQHLQGDDTLRPMVDGQIISGFRRAAADQFLAGTQQACIGVRSLSKNSTSLGGAAWHGGAIHDHLIEIRIITMLSDSRPDSSYAYQIADEVERLLRAGFDQEINNVNYHLSVVRGINFTQLDDDQVSDRIEVQATVRINYIAR